MFKNILTINQEILSQMYEVTINNGNNIIVFGPPGIGKTEIAKQIISNFGYKELYINLSVLEAPDFVGIPFIEHGVSKWAPPAFLPFKDSNTEQVVILFDEIDKCCRELQSPLLEILQFRSINSKSLNIKAVIATGNRQQDMSFSSPVSRALTNRCSIFQLSPDFELWQKWSRDNNLNSLILGFLDHNRNWLLSDDNSELDYCFPSPRSWVAAAKDLDKDTSDSIDFKYKLIAGRVGLDAADKFKLWLTHYKELQPAILEIVGGGYPDAHMNEERILICAISVVKELTLLCKKNPKDFNQIKQMARNVFKWLKTISSSYAVCAMKSSLNIHLVKQNNFFELDEFNDLFDSIEDEMEGY